MLGAIPNIGFSQTFIFSVMDFTTKESILKRLSEEVSGSEKEFYTDEELDKFAQFHTDKWDEETSGWVIAESFVDYFWDSDKPCRRCTVCGRLMREGYCRDGGSDYYCSDECLHSDFSFSDWEEECKNNNQSYWTEWR